MQREIEPMLDGTEVDRAGKSIVDQRHNTVCFSKFDNCLMVCNLQQRVRHGFNIDRLSVGPPFLLPRLRVVAIDEIIGYAKCVEIFRDKIVGPTVQAVLDEQVISVMEECE